MEILVIFIVGAILAVAFAIFAHIQAQKRRDALAAWAAENGWWFNPSNDYECEHRFSLFSALKQGSNRYAYNVIRGSRNGRDISAFDYHYETYSTDSKGRRQTSHHYFSAVILETGLPLKPLFLRPEGFFDKVTEFFGFDDIDFESAEFSRQFYVKSPEKRWAFDVIHGETMEFLLASPRFTIDMHFGAVMAHRGTTFAIDDFRAAFNVLEGLLDRLPPSVVRELKEAGR